MQMTLGLGRVGVELELTRRSWFIDTGSFVFFAMREPARDAPFFWEWRKTGDMGARSLEVAWRRWELHLDLWARDGSGACDEPPDEADEMPSR